MSQVEGPIAPPSVLIIDDELGPRESIRLALEPRFRVTIAESGEQALGVLRQQQVDVVTLDLMIPGIGGIETFKKIREMDSDVQIIIVSGGSLDDLAHALPHTASAWIPKPFDMRTLVEAVERAAEETRRGRLRAAQSRASTLGGVRAPALEGRDERKYDVARMFSHDIKDRLNAILGFVRLLREGHLDGLRPEEALDVIEGNAHEAVTLTVNFLHAEESDGGSLQLHKTPASLNQIVEQVMEDEAPRARSRRIDLQPDLDSGIPSVDLDIAMISRAVTNLLNNAIHYSPPGGGIVRVETRRFADVIILRVRDHGLGIPAEEVPKLFERYGRGAKSASTSSTGLGLYLVRTIVEAHGGSVSATFPPDGGSAFVIVLPCPLHENA
jgi:signal transduction histidine kinase